jgi:hypothetical protein
MDENMIIETAAGEESAIEGKATELPEAPEVCAEETDNTPEEKEEKGEKADGESAPTMAAQTEEAAHDEAVHAYGDGERMDSETFARTLANPMFAVFARGRSGSVEDAVREFEKMIAAGRNVLSEEDIMKMTPGTGFCTAGGVALSERQRKIARDAGMSYREYYEIIRAIPVKTK